MTITLSLIIFVALLVLLQIIGEIFTILFMLTGMPEEKARFQVISLLTTSGYTTKESEMIIENHRRRSLAKAVMLFGYTFTATFVSIFVNVLLQIGRGAASGGFWTWSSVIIAVLIVVLLLFRIKAFRKIIDKFILRLSSRIMFKKKENYMIVLDDYVNSCIAEVKLRTLPDAFKGQTVESLKIKADYGLLILAIQRNGHTISNVTKEQTFEEGDLITVYGPNNIIKSFFVIMQTHNFDSDDN